MEEKKTNKSHPVICPKCKYNRPVALTYCPHCRAEEKKATSDFLANNFIKQHVYKASTKREDTEQKEQQTANGKKANKLKSLPRTGGKATSRAKKPGKQVRNKRGD